MTIVSEAFQIIHSKMISVNHGFIWPTLCSEYNTINSLLNFILRHIGYLRQLIIQILCLSLYDMQWSNVDVQRVFIK